MSRKRGKERSQAFTSSNDDDYSDYSEDFENDSPPSSPGHTRSNIRNKTRLIDKHDSDDLTSSSIATTTRSAKKSTQSEGRRRPTKQSGYNRHGWRSNSFTKDSKKKFSMKDSVQSRMLSAKRHRINTLNNELCEVQIKLEELTKENRFLKTLQHRQDRALRKFEDEENDLPRLISQHSEEQRVLKVRLRKSQDSERHLEKRLRETNEEMQKMENVLRRLKKMVYDKNLGERSELARQLSVAETRLEDTERKNKELNKKLELTTNSFTRQINAERTRHRDTKENFDLLRDEHLVLQAKLKEKERALEVSNIYALRVKQSPEKSFLSGKVALISPRQIEKHSTPKAETPPKAYKSPLAIQESPEPSSYETKANRDTTEVRKTIKSPEPSVRENSALLDLATTPKEKEISRGLNGLHLHEQKPKLERKDKEDPKRQSVFLTANFDSPLTTPSHSFIQDEKKTKPTSPPNQPILQDSLSNTPPAYLPTKETKVPDLQEARRKERQEEMSRQKEEEERRRKADLLAKLRDLEDDSTKPPLGDIKPAVNGINMRKLHSNGTHGNKVLTKQDRVNPNDPKVENLHMGVPSTHDGEKKKNSREASEPDISFGGYAPSLGVQPKRKPKGRQQLPLKSPQSKSSESESDEPLLDLTSGKAKKSDLLSQLFGEQAGKQPSSVTSPNGVKPQSISKLSEPKPMPRAKPVHSGYPWEQNVRAAPTGDKGNGDAGHTFATPLVKPVTSSYNDDDIEEMTL